MHSSRMHTPALYRTGGGGSIEGVSVQGVSVWKQSLSRVVPVQGGLCPSGLGPVNLYQGEPVRQFVQKLTMLTLSEHYEPLNNY